MQFRVGLSYIAVILAVLLLLNTYPLLVSEDLVFHSKATNLQSSVSVMVNALSGLSPLTEENVADAMAVAEEAGLSRILVTDSAGRVLYDTRETGSAVGSMALYTEIVQALLGYDAFSCTFRQGAFRSRASSPIMYQNQVIGAVYAYEYDTEQAALLLGLQDTLLRLSAVAGGLVLVLSLILSKALTHKIGLLLTAIRQVREGAYSHRADIRGRDEIAQIGHEFNSLTDRLQTTENARRRFVSDASHELKTPLAAIRLLSDSILQTENIDPETTKEFVTDIGREAERLSRITEDLLRLTRLDSGVLDPPAAVDILPVYLYDAETGAAPRLAEALLNELLKGPADETLKSALPAGTTLLTLELNGDRALVDLSPSYESLSGVALTLADSAIAMTLSQVPEVSSVQITVRGRELAYREQPVLNLRDILLTPEEDVISTVEARLYFLNQEGRLTAAEQILDLYEGDTQVSAVAKALEGRPEGRDLLSPLPEGFQVKSVWLEEDICYVNLSSALLEGLGESALQTALRALEDSLSSLEAVEEVRFLVDGEFRRDLGAFGGGGE